MPEVASTACFSRMLEAVSREEKEEHPCFPLYRVSRAKQMERRRSWQFCEWICQVASTGIAYQSINDVIALALSNSRVVFFVFFLYTLPEKTCSSLNTSCPFHADRTLPTVFLQSWNGSGKGEKTVMRSCDTLPSLFCTPSISMLKSKLLSR